MIDKIIPDENIALTKAEGIVNAANGFGYMGGIRCIRELHRGVAESLQYASHGEIEKLSREECKKHGLFGYPKGSVFITNAPLLDAIGIIHAVTMKTPGSKARIKTIKKLVPEIIRAAEFLHLKTVAVPLLGTGTGGLQHRIVYDYLMDNLEESTVKFWIYTNHYDRTEDLVKIEIGGKGKRKQAYQKQKGT